MNATDIRRLGNIHTAMSDLLEEAKELMRRGTSPHTYARAKSWIGNISVGLGGGDYIDKYEHTMLKELNALGWNEETQDVEEDLCDDCSELVDDCTCDDEMSDEDGD